ncbi:riboflavin synthase [Candidatus Tachikawaea gelatinosa]|uniref:Riboflavin synthase n=1 Tax=Candidatus Tachikawaea gelatinosa TaxID=1410383 RepID=A0A090AJP6_9ENTR|nr:riboflavin synthase [Candidatus Tachikawaea gelatinosa]BAP58673.1 riboflavin synthase alpha chain [Candidatus Tachikawaea gelatinosa]
MFTGIIQGIAEVVRIEKKKSFHTHTVLLPNNLLQPILKIGSSISYNGCCLTITSIINNFISFDIIKKTLSLTNLHMLKVKDLVNVERSMKINEEIGGHIMTGHIITTAKILQIIPCQNKATCCFIFKITDIQKKKYIFNKGFIGIDGMSLTIYEVKNDIFSVNIIPETLKCTNLKNRLINDVVNIEIDLYTQIIVTTTERFLKNLIYKK